MSKFKRQIWNYGVAIAAVITATLLMLALNPFTDLTKASFLLFFGAVTISAWYGGRGPGMLATVLSSLCAGYFFLEPVLSLNLSFANGLRLLLCILESCLISALVGSLRIAQRQTKESLSQLKASEAKFRRLVDSNIIGVILCDIHGAIANANDVFLNSLGYTREDLLAGRIRWDDMTPTDLKHLDSPALLD
jgi:K+-sensing histidine kinase KdpD